MKFLTEDRIPVIESLVRLVDIGHNDSHRPFQPRKPLL